MQKGLLFIAALVATMVAACSAPASGTAVPAKSTRTPGDSLPSVASPRPSASPTSSAQTAHDGLEAPDTLPYIGQDGLASVITNDLVVRSLPEISDASVIHATALQDGDELFVLDGPVVADGHAWYRVVPLGPELTDDTPPAESLPTIGWVAAGTPADPWIGQWKGECPAAELEAIWRQRPLVLLACFGDQQLELEGLQGDCSYVVPGYISPAWLNSSFCELLPFDVPPDAVAPGRTAFLFHQQTDGPLVTSGQGVAVRLVGHFDDPASQTCVEEPLRGAEATPPDLVVLGCRTRFVATDLQPLERP